MIARESTDEVELCQLELRHDGVSGYGEAAPIERYEESVESARAYVEEHADALGDDPFALDEIFDAAAARASSPRAARSTPPCTTSAGSSPASPVWRLLGLRRGGPPTAWTVWLGDPDDMARRAEQAARRFRRLKLKLGGRDGLDVERVRAVRAVDRRAAPGRRQRVLVARRGARVPPAAGDRVLRAAAPGRRSRRARAEAALAGPDLRRRGLSHARPTSPPARSARTGSTSSSRSPAASARRSAWRTRRARSGSA